MTHAFALWFGRFFPSAGVAALPQPGPEKPLQIEVERLPDRLWRDLGFQQPSRPAENIWPH